MELSVSLQEMLKILKFYTNRIMKNDLIQTLLLLSILLTLAYTFCMWIGFVKVMNEIEEMHVSIERIK